MDYKSKIDSKTYEKIFDICLKSLDGKLLFGSGYLKLPLLCYRLYRKIRILIILYFLGYLFLIIRFYVNYGSLEVLLINLFIIIGAVNILISGASWMRKIRGVVKQRYQELVSKKELFDTKPEFIIWVAVILAMIAVEIYFHSFQIFNLMLWAIIVFSVIIIIFFLRVEHNLKLLIPFPIEKEEFDKITCVPDYIGEPMALKENGGGFYYMIKFENTVTLAYNRRKGTEVKLWIVDLEQNPGFAEVLEKLEKRLGEKRIWVEE